jgi:hypothetical protein
VEDITQKVPEHEFRDLFWCAEHVRQLGGESPLDNLMEVKS